MADSPIARPEPSSPADLPPNLSVSQLADEWSVSEATVRKWIACRVLPAFRVGRSVRIRRAAARAFEEQLGPR